MEKTHIDWIDIVRIVCAYAVVVLHTVSISMTNAGVLLSVQAKSICEAVYSCMNFAVPIFLIITGMLFLGNEKEYTFRDMIKYIRRIILCLVLFGFFFSVLEQLFYDMHFSFRVILKALLAIIEGKTWDHMWYLYFLPGVYLLIPVIKGFKKHTTKRNYVILCILVWIFTYGIPFISNQCGIKIGFPFALNSALFFYVLIGGALADYQPDKKATALSGILALFCFGMIFMMKIYPTYSIKTTYDSIIICVLSITVFIFMKGLLYSVSVPGWISSVAKDTLGIYIVHPILLNGVLKAFHWNPLLWQPVLGTLSFSIAVFLISLAVIHLLRKIKIIQKYLL